MIISDDSINKILKEFAISESSSSTTFSGKSKIIQSISYHFENVKSIVQFLDKCKVRDAKLVLVGGDVPLVRVLLCSGRKRLTVRPKGWLTDVIEYFGIRREGEKNFSERFSLHLSKIIPREFISSVELGIQNVVSVAMTDEKQLAKIRNKLGEKKAAVKRRVLNQIAMTFSTIPHGMVSEDDVIRVWRENTCKQILQG